MRPSGTFSAVPTIVVLLALGIALRLIIAYVLLPGSGFRTDLDSFRVWGEEIARNGPMGFYEDLTAFHDYPPIYLYILGLVGVLTSPWGGIGQAIKVVPMLCDLGLAVVVWKMAEEFGAARWRALLAAFVVIVNPVTWFNSAIWGQADSVGTIFLLLGLRELMKDRRETATALAVLAALTKPQLGILAILVGVVILRRSLWPSNAQPRSPRRIVTSLLAGSLTAAAICLPFVGFRFGTILSELNTPVGIVQTAASVLAGAGVFYVVLTSKNEWIRGSLEETGGALLDPVAILTAAGFAVSAMILFLGIRFEVIIRQMIETFGEYSLLTVNAYNPWALLSAQTDQGPAGMATTLQWVADLPDLTGHHAGGSPVFWFGPFPTAVALAVVLAATGFVFAAAGRFAGRDRFAVLAAACGVVLAAVAAAVASVPGGPLPSTVSIPASLVGETALLTVLAATAIWAASRDDDIGLVVGLTILSIAFFVVPTRAHERYLFPFFGIGAVLFAVSWRWRRLYLVLALANLGNLLAVLGEYNGILTPAMQSFPDRYPLEHLLNDWSSWIRDWHVDSADPHSLIVPIAAISMIMGLGFLWALMQMTPQATEELEAERNLAGLDFVGFDDADEVVDAGGPESEQPAGRPVERRQARGTELEPQIDA